MGGRRQKFPSSFDEKRSEIILGKVWLPVRLGRALSSNNGFFTLYYVRVHRTLKKDNVSRTFPLTLLKGRKDAADGKFVRGFLPPDCIAKAGFGIPSGFFLSIWK